MALPNISSTKTNSPRSLLRNSRKQQQQRRVSISPEIAAILSLGLLACLLFSFHGTHQLVTHHDQTVSIHEVVAHGPPIIKKVIETQTLAHEDMFLSTLKSCLPQKNPSKCKTFIPDEKTKRQRVAILSPPGELTETFFGLVRDVVAKDNSNIELVHTTHMAPYGYGKTHGYTRIIRVVPHPLIVGVTTTLQSSLEPGQTHLNIHMDELKENLRQQIRYHCRLSHISAHTALWTLTLDELTNYTLDELVDEIRIFLGIHEGTQSAGFGSDIIPPEGLRSLFFPMYSYGSAMLTAVQATTTATATNAHDGGSDILQELDMVLLDEMKISKNLTAWPCESFWTVGGSSSSSSSGGGGRGNRNSRPDPNGLSSPRISEIAKALSPDCNDNPLISCWVKRDLCEAKGDGKCSE